MADLDEAGLIPDDPEELLEFLYVCPIGLAEIGLDGAIRIINPVAMQLLFPITPDGQVVNLFDVLGRWAPDLRTAIGNFSGERGTVLENHRVHTDARHGESALILALTLIKLASDRVMVVISDVTEQVQQERRLKQAESWFSAILSGVNDFALLSLDRNGRISSWNKSGERQTGYGRTDTLGRTMNVFYFPEEAVQGRALQQVDLAKRDGWHIDEGWRRRKDGTRYWCQSLVAAVEEASGEIHGFSVVLRDVTERKRDADEIRRLLTLDHLTGVLNRARFFELSEAELVRWQRFGQPLSAIMLDIDHFKSINDQYGHAAGDQILRTLANSIQATLRSIDIFGRLGGEEFAVLLPSIDIDGARLVAERLRQEVASLKSSVGANVIPLTISLGCAQMSAGLETIDGLLRVADKALYEAKLGGRNRVVLREPSRAA